MPSAHFFRNLGLFVAEKFLEPSVCGDLLAQITQTPSNAGTIVREAGEMVDEDVRRVRSVDLGGESRAHVRRRLLDLMPDLQDHFNVVLKDCQGPNFLRYDAGAFYVAHRDGREGGLAGTANRKISAVLFLNQRSDASTQDG